MDSKSVPLILFEDEHLLVVNKPAGMNTHAPSPFTGEGIYEWLRNREPRWQRLAIIHRLDKETSGVLVLGKTPDANRSLTEQFARKTAQKTYRLLTDRKVARKEYVIRSTLFREGERYLSGPAGKPGGEAAETHFRLLGSSVASPSHVEGAISIMEARPVTGRTHQIRVHAAEAGFPILGDVLYGGTRADRVCLHAERLVISHPVSRQPISFEAKPDFDMPRWLGLRKGLIEPNDSNAFRLIHGASDGFEGWYVDQLGDCLLSHSEKSLHADQIKMLETYIRRQQCKGAYHKILNRELRKTTAAEAAPTHVMGDAAPEFFPVRENGLIFELSFAQGYSVGLFLDQRENRRRFLNNYIAPDFPLFEGAPDDAHVLNTFSYTCGFSVCAAKAGATTTSIDLSKKYLEWGKRNFALNGIDSARHDFIYGDVFGWLRRLGKKGRVFDVVVLDPPTFSESREWGAFQAQMDYGKLTTAALPLLRRGGVLLASTNAAGWKAEEFMAVLDSAIGRAGRTIRQRHYAPQPPDFPVTREEPAHLKTVWMRIG